MDDAQRFDMSRYKHWIEDHVRFSDLDPLGHVNNNSISQYFENARAALYQEVTPKWPHRDQIFVLARTSMDFRRELHYPAKLKIGTGVISLGRTSMTTCNALFRGVDGLAYGESVSVFIDNTTRKPIPIPDDLRKTLAKYGS
ncbi:MAG: thioesterase family protein [Alphaproteobacteria bacterium]